MLAYLSRCAYNHPPGVIPDLTPVFGQYYADRLETYKRLLRQWMSWAVSNNVPFSNLHKVPVVKRSCDRNIQLQEIPYTRRYIMMARIEHTNGDPAQDPGTVLYSLSEQSASDVEEITKWVKSQLHIIKTEVSRRNLKLSLPIFQLLILSTIPIVVKHISD